MKRSSVMLSSWGKPAGPEANYCDVYCLHYQVVREIDYCLLIYYQHYCCFFDNVADHHYRLIGQKKESVVDAAELPDGLVVSRLTLRTSPREGKPFRQSHWEGKQNQRGL